MNQTPAAHELAPDAAASVALRAERVCKSVPLSGRTLTLLSDISFTAQAGSATAVVGVSGSGKSTLLGLLAGLDRPTSGEIELAGQRLDHLDEDQRAALRARAVGFVFQSFHLLPTLTALENVCLPLELTGVARPQAAARDMLARVGLDDRLGHYPAQLSGGEQQRVALARAFVVAPQILFADEPTGSLDEETGAAVAELLFELNRERGTTLLLATHDQNLAERCPQQLNLAAGKIVAATPEL